MTTHLTFEQLSDLAEQRLDPEQQQAAEAHVRECERCAEDMNWITHILGVMQESALDTPPANLSASVRTLFHSRRPRRAPLRAVLHYNSNQQPYVAGQRSSTSQEQRLVFKADQYDFDLRIAEAGQRWAVTGQVLGPDTAGSVSLVGAHIAAETALNDLLEFSFPLLASGSYRLTLHLTQIDVVLPDIQLGPRAHP